MIIIGLVKFPFNVFIYSVTNKLIMGYLFFRTPCSVTVYVAKCHTAVHQSYQFFCLKHVFCQCRNHWGAGQGGPGSPKKDFNNGFFYSINKNKLIGTPYSQ